MVRVTLSFAKEEEGEAPSQDLVRRLSEAHSQGRLGEMLLGKGVGRGAIGSCAVRPPRASVAKRPTLPELIDGAREAARHAEEALRALRLSKRARAARAGSAAGGPLAPWAAAVAAAAARMRRAAAPPSPSPSVLPATPNDLAAAASSPGRRCAASRLVGRTTARRSTPGRPRSAAAAPSCAERRARRPSRAITHPTQLRRGATWKARPRRRHRHRVERLVNRRRRRPRAAAADRATYCYYCASLPRPVRAPHPLLECPKRIRAGDAEFSADATAAVVRELQAARDAAAARLSSSAAPRAEVKRAIVRCAGALNAIGRLRSGVHGGAHGGRSDAASPARRARRRRRRERPPRGAEPPSSSSKELYLS